MLDHRSKLFFALACALMLSIPSVQADDLKFWTDSSGKYSVKAEFVKLDGDKVVLKKEDGKTVEIPMEKLNKLSQNQARIAAEKATNPDRGKKVEPTPTETRPSHSTSGTSFGPTSPVEFPPDATIEKFMEIVIGEIRNERVIVLWDALPANYQRDISELAKLVGTKMDPQLFKQYNSLAGRLIKVLRSKKEYIINSRHLANLVPDKNMIVPVYDDGVGLIESYLAIDLINGDNLSSGDVRGLLDRYLQNIISRAKALSAAFPKDLPFAAQLGSTDIDYRIISSNASTATVELTSKGPDAESVTLELTKVQGRWLPSEMVQGWAQNMSVAKKTLSDITPQKSAEMKMQVGMVTSIVGGMMVPLEQASSQQDFDAAIDELIANVQGMIPAGGMGPPGAGGFGPAGF